MKMLKYLTLFVFIFDLWSLSEAAPACDKEDNLLNRHFYKLQDRFYVKCIEDNGNSYEVRDECICSAYKSAIDLMNTDKSNGTEIDFKNVHTNNFGPESYRIP